MNPCTTPHEKDLLDRGSSLCLLWIGPVGLIVISARAGNFLHTAVWTFSFTVMGAACWVNARRCGRRHCFYTGPLLLLMALGSLLYGLGLLPLGQHGWNWISGVAVVGYLLTCCGVETLRGRYVSRPP